MKNPILMSDAEPTDIELKMLMLEVVKTAKIKAALAQKQLAEKILLEISIAQAKFKANKT
jgi:ribosome-binding protein aMBF1 (putative translation factor)